MLDANRIEIARKNGVANVNKRRERQRNACAYRSFDSFFIVYINNVCTVYDKAGAYFYIEVVVLKHESYMFNMVRHLDNETLFFYPLHQMCECICTFSHFYHH